MNLTYSLRAARHSFKDWIRTRIFHRPSANTLRNYRGKLIDKETPFAVLESYRTIRTNLFYTGLMTKSAVIGITSPLAHEGKSLTCANLAITFGMANKRAVIVDCDMRAPSQGMIFSLETDAVGLSDYLSGQVDTVPVIKTSYENLSVVVSGRRPPNPAELLLGDRMESLLKTLKEEYDVIFLDLPPVAVVSDASVVASRVGGYLVVLESFQSDVSNTDRALHLLESVNANILGFVLNNVPQKGRGYGRYKGYSTYSYGEERLSRKERRARKRAARAKKKS